MPHLLRIAPKDVCTVCSMSHVCSSYRTAIQTIHSCLAVLIRKFLTVLSNFRDFSSIFYQTILQNDVGEKD